MSLFSIKRKQRGDLTADYNYLIRGYREDGARPFSEVHGNRMGATDMSWKMQNSKNIYKETFLYHEDSQILE